MKQYRVAIIGTGNSVNNHLSAIRAAGDRVELVAAVDVDEARVSDIAARYQIPRCYTNTTAMLAAEQIDLVHIITPPATHKSLILDCLRAGAWVYCEKPLCLSLAEFDDIARAEADGNCFVSAVAQWRFGSAAKHLRRLIAANALGKPLVGVCNTLWYRDDDYYRMPWRSKWSTAVGGPTATLGIHLIDLFLWLYGDWREVRALSATVERDIEVEDVSMAMVQFENGALGSIVNSVLSPRQQSYLRLDFQQATIEVEALYRYANENWRLSLPENSANAALIDQWQQLQQAPDIPGNHDAQLLELLDSMDQQQRPALSGSDARTTLEFIASLYKSSASASPVLRGSITPDDPYYYAMDGVSKAVERE